MKTFWLKVIASDRVAYNGRCQKVIVPAADGGQMGILADHENMVIAIEVGEAKMQLEDGTWETLAVGTGFLEVVNNPVLPCWCRPLKNRKKLTPEEQKNGVKSWKKNFVRSRVSRNTITRKHPWQEP